MSKANSHTSHASHQPQSIRYEIEKIGYMPFTLKMAEDNIPIYKHTKTTSPKRYRGFSFYNLDNSIDLYESSDLEDRYIIEHESVHVHQRKSETVPSHYRFGPYDYIAYERLIECEAYTRESYKVLHDYYNNVLTIEEMFGNTLVNDPLNQLVTLLSGQSSITTKENFLASLDIIKNDDYFPSENDILAANIICLSFNADFMNDITDVPIQNLHNLNADLKNISLRYGPQDSEDIFKTAGLDVTTCFSEEFDLDKARALLNRDGNDYFADMSVSTQECLMDNLFIFTPAHLKRIKAATPVIRAFNQ